MAIMYNTPGEWCAYDEEYYIESFKHNLKTRWDYRLLMQRAMGIISPTKFTTSAKDNILALCPIGGNGERPKFGWLFGPMWTEKDDLQSYETKLKDWLEKIDSSMEFDDVIDTYTGYIIYENLLSYLI